MAARRPAPARGSRRAPASEAALPVRCLPLTPGRWPDLVTLFGARGACGGCWCMWWRLPRAVFENGKGHSNRAAFRRVVDAGPPPGVLAYAGGEPVGWCAIAPRAVYPRLARSRTLAPVDTAPVWSVTCFFVTRAFRRHGVTEHLLEAAVQLARRHGARVVEGYPIEPGQGAVPAAFAWTGFVPTFLNAGFTEIVRRSPRQPILRRALGNPARR